MIRVRLHGRGGQGMKTAGRILGTAAVLDGREAQDSPVYGAERRGAPMAAFVRIADEPVRERGSIPAPDLVVVADETLLLDAAVRPLAGLPAAGTLLVATPRTAGDVRQETGHPGPIVARDFLDDALEEVGSRAGVSTALAAAACRLLGLSEASAVAAIRTELATIGLPPPLVEANLRVAARARAGLAPARLPAAPRGGVPFATLSDVVYAPPEIGTPSVVGPPNTPLRRTGNWRVFRPVIDLHRCTRCWVCFVRCPEGAIELEDDDTPRVDYAVCKGCLICAEECPIEAIATVREEPAGPRAAVPP
jgi:pyruvate ferredoxin oxidoreductase gamma subunit